MVNYENGRRLTILGFAAYTLSHAIHYLLMYILYSLPDVIGTLASMGEYISLSVIFFGFFIMWSDKKRQIDLVSALVMLIPIFIILLDRYGIISISANIRGHAMIRYGFGMDFLRFSGAIASIFSIIYNAVYYGFIAILVLRSIKSDKLISLLLICAYGFFVLSGSYILSRLGASIDLSATLEYLISIAVETCCLGLCVFERLKETEV